MSSVRLSRRNGLKTQKNSKKTQKKEQITNIVKTENGEAIEIISSYLNIMYFYFVFYIYSFN